MIRFCTLASVLALAACASVEPERSSSGRPETRALTGTIEPIQEPMLSRLASIRVKNLTNGAVQELDIRRFGNGIRVHEISGCVWTKAIDWFAPSDSFANCSTSKNWQSATAQVQRTRSIFPMKVGARGTYERRAVSITNKVSNRRTKCRVRDAVEVVLPSGQAVPAYVVRCDDGRVRRTTWFAPGIGPVAYREVHKKRGLRDAWVRMSVSGLA